MVSRVIIANCVVIQDGNVLSITPLKLIRKLQPTLQVDQIQKITTGSKYSDNRLLSQLSDGIVLFEDLIL
jgi:hypothetical protein